jgi:transcriptional antiterminator RfaH
MSVPILLPGQQWYVAFTQPNSELKSAWHLGNQGFPVYVPRLLRRRSHARHIDHVAVPLFPRYVFLGIDPDRQRWRCVNGTIGVCRLICQGDHPLPIDRQVIAAIARREGDDGFVRLSRIQSFRPGQTVRVTNGAFADQLGFYEGMSDQDRVRILLDLLGRKVRVTIEADLVAAA